MRTEPEQAVVVTGPAIRHFQATVIAGALELYAKTGIRANRAYTPQAMMRVAMDITGDSFRSRDYIGAANALRAWVRVQREQGS